MALLKVPYETPEFADRRLELEIADEQLMFQCLPMEPDPVPDLNLALRQAVEQPHSGPKFSELIKGGKKLTIATENQFRAAPANLMLPYLVSEAQKAGCQVSIIIGSGKVGLLTDEAIREKLGSDIVDSDIPIAHNDVSQPQNYRYLGITRAGTPLFVHKMVADADVVVTISTTQATLWGYGGSGMIIPAVSGDETIEMNHVMSLAPDCVPGNNDCRMQQDKYEALQIAGIDMGINVVVDNQGRVTWMNAGEPVESHKEAVRRYDEIYRFKVPVLRQDKADIIITGTSLATNTLYLHTGWAARNCDPAVRDQGIIIHASPCPGYQDKPGFAIMDVMKAYLPASRSMVVKAIKDFYKRESREKELWLGCVWFKVYEVMTRKKLWLVTDGENLDFCAQIGLRAFASITEAYDNALQEIGPDAKVGFVPYGRYSVIDS